MRHACVDTFGLQAGFAVFSWALDLAILIEPLLMVCTTFNHVIPCKYVARVNVGLDQKPSYGESQEDASICCLPLQHVVS